MINPADGLNGYMMMLTQISKGVGRWALCLVGLVVVLASAHPGLAQGKPTWPVTIITPDGEEHFYQLELAATAKDRSRGLMFREALPETAGMLFVWPGAKKRSFWMKNTLLSLDILFFSSNKKLVSLHEHTTPFSLEGLQSGQPARYVVELNAGQARANGLRRGSVLRLPDALVEELAQQFRRRR